MTPDLLFLTLCPLALEVSLGKASLALAAPKLLTGVIPNPRNGPELLTGVVPNPRNSSWPGAVPTVLTAATHQRASLRRDLLPACLLRIGPGAKERLRGSGDMALLLPGGIYNLLDTPAHAPFAAGCTLKAVTPLWRLAPVMAIGTAQSFGSSGKGGL